jgi:hypothetical protein
MGPVRFIQRINRGILPIGTQNRHPLRASLLVGPARKPSAASLGLARSRQRGPGNGVQATGSRQRGPGNGVQATGPRQWAPGNGLGGERPLVPNAIGGLAAVLGS